MCAEFPYYYKYYDASRAIRLQEAVCVLHLFDLGCFHAVSLAQTRS